jgi:hypothetical protein
VDGLMRYLIFLTARRRRASADMGRWRRTPQTRPDFASFVGCRAQSRMGFPNTAKLGPH